MRRCRHQKRERGEQSKASLHYSYTIRSVLQRSSHETPSRACVLALDATWRWALAQHRTPFSQPGHIRQRAVGPRWPEEPLSQLSWACPRHRWRSRTDICDQAGGRPSLSVEIHVRRAAARRLPYRRAASQRGGLGRPHAWSQMPAPPALPSGEEGRPIELSRE